MMPKLIAKQINKDRSNGVYAINARMTVNDLTVRRGTDSLSHFVTAFNEAMSYLPQKNQYRCDQCYKAQLSEDWTMAIVIKLHPGSTKDATLLWEITVEK